MKRGGGHEVGDQPREGGLKSLLFDQARFVGTSGKEGKTVARGGVREQRRRFAGGLKKREARAGRERGGQKARNLASWGTGRKGTRSPSFRKEHCGSCD